MRKWITFLMTFLVGSVSYAGAYWNGDTSQVTFEAGYRRDNITWSARVPECDPLFKATTNFKDLDIFQLGVRGKTNLGCNVYARGAFDWGWIFDGELEDKFYIFDRNGKGSITTSETYTDSCSCSDTYTDTYTSSCSSSSSSSGCCCCSNEPFSGREALQARSKNIIDGEWVLDLTIALGYPFYFCDCTMAVAPVVGYTFNEQNLWVDSNDNFELRHEKGRFELFKTSECCKDKFIARWYGPFVGLDWCYNPCDCWGIWAELEYHWAQFNAKKHDHGNGDFSTFNHFDSITRHGHGWVFAAGADYDFNQCWSAGLDVKVQNWGAHRNHRGCRNEFFNDDESGRISTHVKWQSFAISATLKKIF